MTWLKSTVANASFHCKMHTHHIHNRVNSTHPHRGLLLQFAKRPCFDTVWCIDRGAARGKWPQASQANRRETQPPTIGVHVLHCSCEEERGGKKWEIRQIWSSGEGYGRRQNKQQYGDGDGFNSKRECVETDKDKTCCTVRPNLVKM